MARLQSSRRAAWLLASVAAAVVGTSTTAHAQLAIHTTEAAWLQQLARLWRPV